MHPNKTNNLLNLFGCLLLQKRILMSLVHYTQKGKAKLAIAEYTFGITSYMFLDTVRSDASYMINCWTT